MILTLEMLDELDEFKLSRLVCRLVTCYIDNVTMNLNYPTKFLDRMLFLSPPSSSSC